MDTDLSVKSQNRLNSLSGFSPISYKVRQVCIVAN
ncbi:protein of unknown function (plasmid) [Cupriavidus taiwanensis]|uniref:Uncharacterized protein n=1 Tax=Cupriavidus taiwanensis TaxID=164546 RepID=A0A375IQT5_9BURK|nr:protein of unknown function [Cupriavidus taiwanensis]